MASKGSAVRFWRSVHLYFGLFISPAMLFFALTGVAQTLSLHESAGTSYKPPAWLATLGQIHKKQTWKVPVRREAGLPSPATGAPASAPQTNDRGRQHDDAGSGTEGRHDHGRGGLGQHEDARIAAGVAGPDRTALPQVNPTGPQQPRTLAAKERQHLPLKIFFIVASLGLFVSTTTGIYMAYVYRNNRLWVTAALVAGVVLPLILLPF